MKHYALTAAVVLSALMLTACNGKNENSDNTAILPAETTVTAAETTIVTTTAAQTSAPAATTETTATETAVATDVSAEVTIPEQTEPPQVTATPQTTPPPAPADSNLFAELTLGKDCSQYIASHQQFNSKDEAPSCLGDGKDCSYFYNGYSLYTYRDEKGEILTEVDITGKGYTDMKGAAFGMTRAQIEGIYGKSDDDRYEVGDSTVEFTYQNDTVQMIAIFKPLE